MKTNSLMIKYIERKKQLLDFIQFLFIFILLKSVVLIENRINKFLKKYKLCIQILTLTKTFANCR